MFDRIRETTWGAIGVVLVLQIASSLVVNAVMFQGFVGRGLKRLHMSTGGFVEPNLIANLVPLTVVLGIGIFLVSRLRPRDTGLATSAVPTALVGIVLFWLAIQAVLVALLLAEGAPLRINGSWATPGAGYVLGGLAGQLLGNALAEEALFRGFLFPQLLIKFRRRMSGRAALGVAALGSQILFALIHIPNRLLVKGLDVGPALVGDQMTLVIFGLLFLALYLATRNLLFVVGVHAIGNDPTSLVAVNRQTSDLVFLSLILAVVILWPFVRRMKETRVRAA